jgi:hypothetical protein
MTVILAIGTAPLSSQITGLDGAVSVWLFDEGWGNSAINAVDETFNGTTIADAGWVTGMYDMALSFDGDLDAVEVPSNPLMGAHALTIQAYIKPSSIPDGSSGKIFNIALERETEGVDRFMLDILPSGNETEWVLSHFMSIAGTVTDPEDELLASGTFHPFNQWYHVAMVFDSVAADSVAIRHYVNHALEYETLYVLDTLTQGEVFIGERYAPKGDPPLRNYFDGSMDNLVLHDYALTTEEFMPAPGTVDFDAEPRSGTAPLVVSFINGSPSDITAWSWNFGDGQTSALKDPFHTYNNPGSYSVILIGTGAAGADTLERADYITATSTIAVDSKWGDVPQTFELAQNHPNPFNPETLIRYQLPRGSSMSLRIYDIAGRPVKTIAAGYRSPGYHNVLWDGRDDMGNEAASGIYFYSLDAGEFRETRRMVLLR